MPNKTLTLALMDPPYEDSVLDRALRVIDREVTDATVVVEQPKDLIAASGPPGSLCVRLWTVTKPGAAPPDYLACITPREDAETTWGDAVRASPHEGCRRRVDAAPLPLSRRRG